jgi:hypothetical protein
MTATATAQLGDLNPGISGENATALANAPADRLMIRKDLAHFEARIASYPEEVRDDVTWLYQFNQAQFSGHYPLLAHLIRTEGKMELTDQYIYQVLSGRYFRPDPKRAGKVLGSIETLKEVVEWLRRWAIFNSESGGMPFVETPTWHQLDDYITGICAPENPCKFGAVCGSTGTGKSRMLKRHALLNNHGMTAHIEAPSSGRLPRFQMKLGVPFGIALSAETHERVVRLAESITSKRRIIVDNVQKLYNPKTGANQPVLNYLQELQDDTSCTIILSWTPVFTRTLADPTNTQYFEQFVGRLGGLERIHNVPEYATMGDLRAIQDKYRVGGGEKALAIMKRWSREPGRNRILFSRLYLAKLEANDSSTKEIKLAHLQAADIRPVPATLDDEGGAS